MTKEELAEDLMARFTQHKHKYNTLVKWDSLKLTPKRIVQIATTLGGKAVSCIVKNYCRDYKYWNHGMPDLILWSEK